MLLLGAAPVAAHRGITLRGVTVREGPTGTTIAVELSHPERPTVSITRDQDGRIVRVYVDLPPGSRLAPSVRAGVRAAAQGDPVRIGLTEEGGLRIVLPVAGARDYRLHREGAGRVLVVDLPAPTEDPASTTPAPSAVPPPSVPGPMPAHQARSPGAPRRGGAPKIVLDPGHGGRDPGAEGFVREKDVTLAIARRIALLLRRDLGAEVVLTRTTDQTLSLADRTARANAEGADLFVSIHANANPTGRLHGVETYYLDNTEDRATIRLAALENGLQLPPGGKDRASLRYILSDLVQVGKMEESTALASSVQDSLVRQLRRRYPDVTDLGVRRGPFYVLVGAYMPCVLVETAFLSHPREGRRLARADYQTAIAEGIAAGVARFLHNGARSRTL